MEAFKPLEEHDAELECELADTHEKVRVSMAQADAEELIPVDKVFDELRRRHDDTSELGKKEESN